MGVEGFLRVVKDALEEAHLRKFSGQTIVVDAFSWLHKAYVLLQCVCIRVSQLRILKRHS